MIGEMTRNENGTVTGWIAEMHYDFQHVFLAENESGNDADFAVIGKSPRGRDLPLGYVWEHAARESGEVYFGGYIKSGLSGFVPLRLLQSRRKPGVWNVVRKDDQPRQSRPQQAQLPPPPAPKRAPKRTAAPKQAEPVTA